MNPILQKALDSGSQADLDAVSEWWADGLHAREADPAVARTLVERGAKLSPHAAAALGFTDELRAMLQADPAVIDAKGCDACTPLHFARDVATADLLLAHGARIDARDEDHLSTPAQWLIGPAPDVARYLISRGATADIFLAAALGDLALAERLIAADPNCTSHRIGKAPEFPPLGNGLGGTIYQWTLAFNSYAHQVALLKGHADLFDLLYRHSDTRTRFLVSCLLARREEARAIAAANPGLVAGLPEADLELLPRYCWETNTNYDAVKLMLELGFPVTQTERSHGYTALHNAAWSGSADLVELLLQYGAPVDLQDPGFSSTPLGYALYDCLFEKRHPEGDFRRTIELLIDAGSAWDPLEYPTGEPQVDDVYRARLTTRSDGLALLGDEAALNTMLGGHPSPEFLALALCGAAKGGHLNLCRTLLDRGASVNSHAGMDSVTPLMCALWGASRDVALLLLSQGADIAATNRYGTLPLHYAAGYGADEATVRAVLDAGAAAHVGTPNRNGRTPLMVAEARASAQIVTLLKAAQTRL